jgi:hypothetical protein
MTVKARGAHAAGKPLEALAVVLDAIRDQG